MTETHPLVVLHRVLYGTIDKAEALNYLHSHLRDDADLADMGRPLKYQYSGATHNNNNNNNNTRRNHD